MVEGCLVEIQTILGWIINSSKLTVHLPIWTAAIKAMIATNQSNKLTSKMVLHSMIGKVNHAAGYSAKGITNRLRFRLKMIQLNRFQHGHLHKSEVEDLWLWIVML